MSTAPSPPSVAASSSSQTVPTDTPLPTDVLITPFPPRPGFTTLCRSLHSLLEAGRYRQVWNVTNDILTRALKLIDPITADFLRDDDDDESASTFLLFHEYLIYSITAPGWALILALQREHGDPLQPTPTLTLHPEVAAQVFNFFTGAQKIANSLCRTVLANAKGRAGLVERAWKVRAMLLEETRQAVESLYDVDTNVVARVARSPFGADAAMEPWQVLEALIPAELKLRSKRDVNEFLRRWADSVEGEGPGGGTGQSE